MSARWVEYEVVFLDRTDHAARRPGRIDPHPADPG